MKIRTTIQTFAGDLIECECNGNCETCFADQNAICDAHVAEAYRLMDEKEKSCEN